MARTQSNSSTLMGWIIIAGMVALGREYPFLSWVFGTMFVGVIAGAFYAAWYTKKISMNPKWLQILFRANIALWIVPPLGFFTSSATFGINLKNKDQDRKIYNHLAGLISFSVFLYREYCLSTLFDTYNFQPIS